MGSEINTHLIQISTTVHKPGPPRLGSVISFSACPCLPTHTFAVDQELICSSRTPSYTFASFLPPLPAAVLVSGDQKGNTNAPAKMMYVDLYNFVINDIVLLGTYMQWKAELWVYVCYQEKERLKKKMNL